VTLAQADRRLLRGEGQSEGDGQESGGEFSGYGHRGSGPRSVIQGQCDRAVPEFGEMLPKIA